jgi:polyhydroxyalkanoate synthesis regulator phasin
MTDPNAPEQNGTDQAAQNETGQDQAAQKVHDLVEDTVAKAGEIAEHARAAVDDTVANAKSVVDDTVANAKSAVNNFDDTADTAVTAVRVYALELLDKVSAAYKNNPSRVVAIATGAVAVLATVMTVSGRRNSR